MVCFTSFCSATGLVTVSLAISCYQCHSDDGDCYNEPECNCHDNGGYGNLAEHVVDCTALAAAGNAVEDNGRCFKKKGRAKIIGTWYYESMYSPITLYQKSLMNGRVYKWMEHGTS